MGRSNPRPQIDNPVKYAVSFNGKHGHWKFYNLETKESEDKESLSFVFLQDRFGVTGYDMKKSVSIKSNPVGNLDEEMKVYAYGKDGGKSLIAEGRWAGIKNTVNSKKGNYTNFVYALVFIDDKWEIARIEIATTALNAYINFKKTANVEGEILVHTSKCSDEENGGVKYKKPIFEAKTPKDKSVFDEALRVDRDIVLPYLEAVSEFMSSRKKALIAKKEANKEVLEEASEVVSKSISQEEFEKSANEDLKVDDDDDDDDDDLPF